MGQSLAVKYRPQILSEVIGQDITVKILEKAVEQNNLKHAYLFAGDSGCGKTTCARAFAKAINKGIGVPIEIDAASNNGVDQVRSIIEDAKQRALAGEYKIFIIDECHMITKEGWNAFLKGIEETPEYTIYIFCTTDPTKVPATILNRVQRYNITKIKSQDIVNRLKYICQQEGFTNYEAACDLISKIAQGGMRDAISFLEQCADYSKDLSIENVKKVLPGLNYEIMLRLTNYLIDGNPSGMLALVDSIAANGTDLKQFINVYLEFIVDIVKYILFKQIDVTNIPAYLETTSDNSINIKYTIAIDNAKVWFSNLADLLLEVKSAIKYDNSYAATIKAYFLKVIRGLK